MPECWRMPSERSLKPGIGSIPLTLKLSSSANYPGRQKSSPRLKCHRPIRSNRTYGVISRSFRNWKRICPELGSANFGNASPLQKKPSGSAGYHRQTARQVSNQKNPPLPAEEVLRILRQSAMTVAEGTVEVAVGALQTAFRQLVVIMEELNATLRQMDETTEKLAAAMATSYSTVSSKEDMSGSDQNPTPHQDIAILRSISGVDRIALAILLAEAYHLIEKRDRSALRCLTGIAPVIRRSGKQHYVVRWLVAHPRFREARYHWARVVVQRDSISQRKYTGLRQRGHKHARVLRSVADRLISVACARLQNGTVYNPSQAKANSAN